MTRIEKLIAEAAKIDGISPTALWGLSTQMKIERVLDALRAARPDLEAVNEMHVALVELTETTRSLTNVVNKVFPPPPAER